MSEYSENDKYYGDVREKAEQAESKAVSQVWKRAYARLADAANHVQMLNANMERMANDGK